MSKNNNCFIEYRSSSSNLCPIKISHNVINFIVRIQLLLSLLFISLCILLSTVLLPALFSHLVVIIYNYIIKVLQKIILMMMIMHFTITMKILPWLCFKEWEGEKMVRHTGKCILHIPKLFTYILIGIMKRQHLIQPCEPCNE